MSKIMLVLSVVMLAASGKPDPTDTVDSLVANPERLKETRQQCNSDCSTLGDEVCNRVAEATNKRFFGDGKVLSNPPKESPKL